MVQAPRNIDCVRDGSVLDRPDCCQRGATYSRRRRVHALEYRSSSGYSATTDPSASVVTRSILKAGHYSGLFPIDDNAQWEKNAAALKRLHNLRERLRALEKNSDNGTKP